MRPRSWPPRVERREQDRQRRFSLDERRRQPLLGLPAAATSLISTGWRVSIRICVVGARLERHRLVRESNARARSCTGSGSGLASKSKMPMSTTWASKISWILSPTRSYIACMSSFAARPCWTLLMIASSAARSSVSVSRRLRLVEQARVLERHAQAAGERRQQADVGLAEGVLAVEVLKRDDAARPRRRRRAARTGTTWRRLARHDALLADSRTALRTSSLMTSGSRVSQHVLAVDR